MAHLLAYEDWAYEAYEDWAYLPYQAGYCSG